MGEERTNSGCQSPWETVLINSWPATARNASTSLAPRLQCSHGCNSTIAMERQRSLSPCTKSSRLSQKSPGTDEKRVVCPGLHHADPLLRQLALFFSSDTISGRWPPIGMRARLLDCA